MEIPKQFRRQKVRITLPRALEVILDGCMCNKGKGETYVLLNNLGSNMDVQGIAEATCPHCIRGMDFRYSIYFAEGTGEPRVKFEDRKPYSGNLKDRVVTLTPTNQ